MLGQARDDFECSSVFWLLHPIEVCVFHFHPFADPSKNVLDFPQNPQTHLLWVQTAGLVIGPRFGTKDTFGRLGLG